MNNSYAPPFGDTLFWMLFFFLALYTVGHLLFSLYHCRMIEKNSSLFLKLLIGIIVSVTTYALARSHFNTIFLLSLIICFIFAFSIKKNTISRIIYILFQIEYKQLLLCIILLIVFYSVSYYTFYLRWNGAVFGDFYYYSSMSEFFNTTGIETNLPDWASRQMDIVPYHYFSSWFTALAATFSSKLPLATYLLFYLPISVLLVFQGAFSIALLLYKKTNKQAYLVCFMLAFLSLFFQDIRSQLLHSFGFDQLAGVVLSPKLAIVFMLFEGIVILYVYKKYRYAFYTSLLILPFFTPVAPACFSGVFLVLSYLFFAKIIRFKDYFSYTAILVFFVAAFGLFYWYQPGNTGLAEANPIQLSWLYKWDKTYRHILFFGVLPTVIFFVSTILVQRKLLHHTWYQQISKETRLSLIITFASFAGSLFILPLISIYSHYQHNANQLFSNFLSVFFTIFCLIMAVLILKNIKSYGLSFALLLAAGVYYASYNTVPYYLYKKFYPEMEADDQYFKTIVPLIKNRPDFHFAYFRNYETQRELRGPYWSLYMNYPLLNVPDNRIAHFIPNYVPIGLSPFDIPDTSDKGFAEKKDFSFYQFVEQQKMDGTFLDLQTSMEHFIDHHNIRFIIVEPTATYPSFINERSQFCVENQKNGNKFIMLK